MLGITSLPTYLAGLIVIIVLPGPNAMYVLSVAARRGVKDGYRAAAGVWTGDAILMLLSTVGVASLLRSSEVAFGVLKFLGAGYLVWIAIGLIRASYSIWRSRKSVSEQAGDQVEEISHTSVERPFRRALIISLVNPKAILFFMAFFVQFVDPGYPHPWATFLVLGAMAEVVSWVYLSAVIFLGVRLSATFRRRRALTATAASGAAALFLAFAAKLSVSSI